MARPTTRISGTAQTLSDNERAPVRGSLPRELLARKGRVSMKNWRIVIATLIGAGASAAATPAALAEPPSTPPRADAWYVVMCLAPGETTPTAFERVDARAVEVGNKDEQVARYGDHHPGWQCWVEPGQ